MNRYKHSWIILGVMVLLMLAGNMLNGETKAFAKPLTYDFTYTATDTVKGVTTCGIIVSFESLLKNTGTQPDTYTVTWEELSPTPADWWARFCVGGVCYDSNIYTVETYLDTTETAQVLMDVKPRSTGVGKFKVTVTSHFNPSLSKSKTFILNAHCDAPVTNEWGLIILILLLVASGMYLILRKYRMVRQA